MIKDILQYTILLYLHASNFNLFNKALSVSFFVDYIDKIIYKKIYNLIYNWAKY